MRMRGVGVARLGAAALAVLVIAAPARAQQVDNFSALELGVGGALQADGTFADQWTSSPSASVRAATPYHGGLGYLTLRADLHRGVTDDLPDFLALQAAGGWGPVVMLPARIRLLPSAHLGLVALQFDADDEFPGALQNESEVEIGISGRIDIPVARSVRVWAGVDAVRLFTTPRELLIFGEAGLSVSLSAPEWFRWALR
jgi:hypothetical protein